MDTRGKINAFDEKIDLQKLVDVLWIRSANKFAKFHAKKTTEMKIFQKVLGGGYFFLKHPIPVMLLYVYINDSVIKDMAFRSYVLGTDATENCA